jgi:uncharacterized protein
MSFVDTSAWFAAYVPSDPMHQVIQSAMSSADRLVTSDYVLDETLTLLKARGHVDRAYRLGPRLLEGRATQLEYVVPADVQQAWVVFSTYRDKQWSFTDCTSFALMKRLGITAAIALDEHFEQMPGILRVPLNG